jgi:hypothetical protein
MGHPPWWQREIVKSFSLFTARLKSHNKAKTLHPKELLLLKYHTLRP